jgi:hypothetical protein
MSGYIGPAPVPQATQTRQTFTATSGQTSFATIGYVAGGQFIQVYLNGVLLKLTDDYTAANGSDIVLTSGAATGDILEFITFADFTVNNQNFTGTTTAADLSVTGAFTSQGIDDNATSTAMTLDGSGNLLVGTTDNNPANDTSGTGGIALGAASYIAVGRANDPSLFVNRIGSDGDIAKFYRSGSTVGAVGTFADRPYFTGTVGIGLSNDDLRPTSDSGANNDASVDLGHSTVRWRNLYLSGGAYLGGTGSSNKLDDYEEGTWTPTNNGTSNVTIDNRGAKYTKIGQLVTIQMYIGITATSTDVCVIGGLPFAATSTNNEFAAGTINHNTSAGEGLCRISYGTSLIRVLNTNNNSKTWNQFNNSFIITTISYITDA